MRREFEISQDQLDGLLNASKPVPYLIVGGRGPRSPQENANTAWQALGEELGFDYMTVKPIPGKSNRFFMADVAADAPFSESKAHRFRRYRYKE